MQLSVSIDSKPDKFYGGLDLKQSIGVLLVLLIFSMACNLTTSSSGNDPTPISIGNSLSTSTPTGTPQNTATPGPTATATATTRPFATSTQFVSCVPNTTWPLYSVQQGDTLGTIAQRTGTTTDVLVSANCLTNPDVISVGQALRVPQIPVASPVVGLFEISPAQILGSGAGVTYLVDPGVLVGLKANATNVVLVNFYVAEAEGQAGTLLGTDTNLRDGGAWSWTVPSDASGQVVMWAEGVGVSGEIARSNTVPVVWNVATNDPTIGDLRILPSTVRDDGIIEVEPETTVTLSVAASNLTSVSFYSAPTGTGVTPTLIGTDNHMDDGASVLWDVPAGSANLHLWAVGVTSSGQELSNQIEMVMWFENCTESWFFTFETYQPTGCPIAVQTLDVLAQDFEGGRVFWLPIATTDGRQYFFVIYNTGRFEYVADEWDGTPLDNSDFSPSDGLTVPVDRIGWLWRNNDTVRANLGFAYTIEESFVGRFQTTEFAYDHQVFPPQEPGWSLYIDYGKEGLVLSLSIVSASNGGSTWELAGYYE